MTRRHRQTTRAAAVAALALLLGAATPARASGEPVGTAPPEWQVPTWLNSPPLTLRALRGQVVLVRWWTAPDCPYCHATAPALNELHRTLRGRGLRVVGLYHHKSDDPLRVEDVKKYARDFQFEFPVGIDADWRTLKRWWLDGSRRAFTSVTFLIDRDGIIRFIHPGGQYLKGDKDYLALRAQIEALLARR